jgi:hypothetical protein
VAVLSPWFTTAPPSTVGPAAAESANTAVTHDAPAGASGALGERSGANQSALLIPSNADREGGALLLSAGEQITIGAATAEPRPTHADTAVVTAWTKHELVFDATSLTDVVQEFNRYNTRQMIVDDPSLERLHITGIFSSADPSALIRFLRAQRDVVVLETDRDIRIATK